MDIIYMGIDQAKNLEHLVPRDRTAIFITLMVTDGVIECSFPRLIRPKVRRQFTSVDCQSQCGNTLRVPVANRGTIQTCEVYLTLGTRRYNNSHDTPTWLLAVGWESVGVIELSGETPAATLLLVRNLKYSIN